MTESNIENLQKENANLKKEITRLQTELTYAKLNYGEEQKKHEEDLRQLTDSFLEQRQLNARKIEDLEARIDQQALENSEYRYENAGLLAKYNMAMQQLSDCTEALGTISEAMKSIDLIQLYGITDSVPPTSSANSIDSIDHDDKGAIASTS